MKTVKDFKDAGCPIIIGDTVCGRTGKNPTIVNPVTIEFQEDLWVIESFAWRTNTGVKPEFSGDIDIIFKDDDNIYYREESTFYWEDGSVESNIVKWRPHLPKVEGKPKSPYDVDAHVSEAASIGHCANKTEMPDFKLKPVFTQAMADAGELVKAGMMFRTEAGEYEYEAELVNDVSLCFVDEEGYHVGLPIKQAKPIQTEREKAIDEMLMTAIESKDDIAKSIIYEACVKLANAGYRLQTPKSNVT